jgi:hypothetical protein
LPDPAEDVVAGVLVTAYEVPPSATNSAR